jgi:hypothetical protein
MSRGSADSEDDQQELPAQVLQQLEEADLGHQLRQRAEHDHDEQEAGDVEAEHDRAQRLQGVHAGLADNGGHGAEGTDGRGPHDHAEDAEDQPLDVLDAAQHRLTGATHGLQREAHEQRDQQRLEHLALGEGRDERGRDDPEQEVDGTLGGGLGLGVSDALHGLGQVHPAARVDDVADDQADGECHEGHGDEVAEREPADLADLGGLPYGADAEHDRAEDDRRDHHLDQAHEARADRLELLGEVRRGESHGDAEGHRDDHRDVEIVGTVPLGCGCGRCGERCAGHGCPP